MVLVKNRLGLADVNLTARGLRPGQDREPLDVVAGERIIGGHGRHALEPAKLLEGFLLGFLRHAGGFDLLAQILDVLLALVDIAEFLLDGLHLLAQVVIALRLLDLVLNLGLNLVAKLLDLELLGKVLVDALQARGDVGRFEQLLLVGGGEERERRGNKVNEAPRILDVHGDRLQLIRQSRRGRDDLLKLRKNVALQRLDFGAWLRGNLRDRLDRGGHERLDLREHAQLDPLGAFSEDEQALVGHFDDLVDGRQSSISVQVGRLGRVHACVALSDHHDGLLVSE